MSFLNRAASGMKNFARKAWKGSADDFVVRASSEAGEVVANGARQAEVVRFMNAGADELNDIAENIGKNKFKPKNMEGYIGEIDELAKHKEKGFNDDYLKKIREDRMNKWDLSNQEKIDSLNKNIKTAKIEGGKESYEQQLKDIQAERAKYEHSLNGKDFKKEARGEFNKEKYEELVARDKAEWIKNNPQYKIEEIDITDAKASSQQGRSELGNYTQNAKYIIDEQGNRRLWKVTDKGVSKDTTGTYKMVERDVENLGDKKAYGGIKGMFSADSRRMNRMNKAYENSTGNSLSSNLIKMGVGTGITGAAVLAMSDNRGQQTNSQLYGQY